MFLTNICEVNPGINNKNKAYKKNRIAIHLLLIDLINRKNRFETEEVK